MGCSVFLECLFLGFSSVYFRSSWVYDYCRVHHFCEVPLMPASEKLDEILGKASGKTHVGISWLLVNNPVYSTKRSRANLVDNFVAIDSSQLIIIIINWSIVARRLRVQICNLRHNQRSHSGTWIQIWVFFVVYRRNVAWLTETRQTWTASHHWSS